MTHLVIEYDSAFRVVISGMNPGVCWEENGSSSEAMNDDLHKVELFPVKISDENCTRASKLTWDAEISSVLHNVRYVRRLRYPPFHVALHAFPRISN